MVEDCVELCKQTLEEMKEMANTVKTAVNTPIKENTTANGQVSAAALKKILEDHETSIGKMLDEKLNKLPVVPGGANEETVEEPEEEEEHPACNGFAPGFVENSFFSFTHSDGTWDVPENFDFPSQVRIEHGWKLWVNGMPGLQVKGPNGELLKAPVRPFWMFELKRLPKDVRQKFQLHWHRIFTVMMVRWETFHCLKQMQMEFQGNC